MKIDRLLGEAQTIAMINVAIVTTILVVIVLVFLCACCGLWAGWETGILPTPAL